jgi:hypothetical protein
MYAVALSLRRFSLFGHWDGVRTVRVSVISRWVIEAMKVACTSR